ncbi:hypothetical protein ACPPVO_30005 [Dactylosporangium sp. McL0621]|uniref:hypothetical protein n=1 Tax=Dactylosporangium sp. McL0621 TaxID=3415678 RepID=UPI003CEBB572
MTNDDLNKIRDAARRARGDAPGPPPTPAPRPPSDSQVAPPPRPTPRPAPRAAQRPAGGGQFGIRLQRGGWTLLTMLLVIWLVGVVWQTWFGHGYEPDEGHDVGRHAARAQAALALLCLVAAFALTLVLGRLGAWLGVLAAALVARFPEWVPDPLGEWSARHVPDWCASALLDLGGWYGERLRLVAYGLYPVLILLTLVQAVRRR